MTNISLLEKTAKETEIWAHRVMKARQYIGLITNHSPKHDLRRRWQNYTLLISERDYEKSLKLA